MSTPLDVLGFYKTVFKFFGAYEIDCDSKILKRLMIIYTIGYQLLFTDLGCVLFTLSLLQSTSPKETLQILFVVFAYFNAVIKGTIFFTNRKQFKTLWLKLDDPEFLARNLTEERLRQLVICDYCVVVHLKSFLIVSYSFIYFMLSIQELDMHVRTYVVGCM